jgi:hypothetical protein
LADAVETTLDFRPKLQYRGPRNGGRGSSAQLRLHFLELIPQNQFWRGCPSSELRQSLKKTPTPSAMSGIVNESASRHASIGNRDSGNLSSPRARLLDGKFRRRFTKLENKSPAIAAPATIAPIVRSRPISGAIAVVIRTEIKIPRMVFDGPSHGRPSKNMVPASSGKEQRGPKIFFATIGVPLASVAKTNNCRICRSCIFSA